MEDVSDALMIAFASLLFIIGFSVAMFMFSQVTETAEKLTFYIDPTAYYDNIKFDESVLGSYDDDIKSGKSRIVGADTLISTLYRYADEEFCIKIYDENNDLLQVFDLDTESKVHSAAGTTTAFKGTGDLEKTQKEMYKEVYNDKSKPYYMFEAPWLSTKDFIKKRIDLFLTASAGYIGSAPIDYSQKDRKKVKEAIDARLQL